MTRMIHFEPRPDGVCVFWLDVPDAAQNTFKPEFKAELAENLEMARSSGVRAAVIASRKAGSFLAGGDLEAFRHMARSDEAAERARALQRSLGEIESAEIPFVAAIDGACLGGGLELALACAARVASDHPKTKLGLPEVQLGLLPAGGGTQRLPEIVGLEAALDLMLTGKQLDGDRAKKLGLVDDVVDAAILVEVAAALGLQLAESRKSRSLQSRFRKIADPGRLKEMALARNPAGRKLVFAQAEKRLRRSAGAHYPAPYEILEATRVGLERGLAAGLEAEAEAFGRLMVTDVSRRLVDIFFATTALKRDNGTDQPNLEPRPVRRIGVVGAGAMGHGIASVTSSRARLPVRMHDLDDDAVARGLKAIRALAEARGAERRTRGLEVEHELLRVSGCTDYSGFEGCDVVIEATVEDLDVKHRILREVEARCEPDTIFASNTSSIPIARIAAKASRPENVLGMRYFTPVSKTPLLEIVRTDQTSDEVVATCVGLGKRQGKTVIVVNDRVGFYTSRILGPYINEAMWMLMDGIPVETIDAAAEAFGFPVGPLALLDEIGIDTATKVARAAGEAFGERLLAPRPLEALVEDGRAGREGGRGVYLHDGPPARPAPKTVDSSVYSVIGARPNHKKRHDLSSLGERLALTMVAEAIRCLEEGVLRGPRDGDVGAVYGLGFPPFRGGPFRYADAVGPAEILRRARSLEERFGVRFEPPRRLVDHAARGRRFHA